MRSVLIWLVCAACGRIGFDDQATAAKAWLDPAWPYRVPFTIDHTKVAADLVEFPVLIQIDDAAVAAHAGGNYEFVGRLGNALSHELDADAAQPNRVLAWVRIPALSSTTDTTGYVYYGNAAASTTTGRDVWMNGYAGVYHFGDGAALDVHDSTTVNDGANSGAAASAGMIGGAAHLDGNSNVAVPTTGLDTTPGAVNTVSLWLYFVPPYNRGIVAFSDASDTFVYDVWFETDGCQGFNTGQGEVLGTTATGLSGKWRYVVAQFLNGQPTYSPATASTNALYIDGAPQGLSTCSTGSPVPASAYPLLRWGSNVHGSTNYRMVGHIDEGRMSVGARSPQWIATEYANQSAPATFVSVGPEEMY